MLVHGIVTKNLIVDAVCGTNLDNGATLSFFNDQQVMIGSILLEVDAFAAAYNGQAVANNFPKTAQVVASTSAGPVTKFQIMGYDSILRIIGTVTIAGGGGDIELSDVNYNIGESITLQSLIYRVPN